LKAAGLLLFIFCLSLAAGPALGSDAHPASPRTDSPEALLSFARMLIGEGEYYRAVTELKRYIFLYPEEERPEAENLLGQAFLAGGEHHQAALVFSRMAEDYPDQVWGMKGLIGLARARLADNDPPGARKALEELLMGDSPPRIIDEARIWSALSFMEEGRWGEASEVLGEISEDPLGVQMALAAKEGGQLPSRSPALSGFMSAVVPGSGQL